MKKYVKCDSCNIKYENYYSETQAKNCSSEYQKSTGRLFGHYGSNIIDLQVWKFVEEVDYHNGAILCDTCVQKHIDNNDLIFIKDYAVEYYNEK